MKVLLPIDGSDCAARTVKWAAETLNRDTTQYYILHVIPFHYEEISIIEYELDDTQAMLDKTAAFLKEAGCHVEKTEYMQGDPVRAICDYAEEMQVDQVFIGSHGRTGLKKFLLGSVSLAVLEQCKRPVVIYRNLVSEPAVSSVIPSGTVL